MAEQASKKLHFHQDGIFRILHMTDIQESIHIHKDTHLLMEAALDAGTPDLVVLTGDQFAGYRTCFRGITEAALEKYLRELFSPILRQEIPIAVTFGNHDRQCGLSNETQMRIYQRLPCVFIPDADDDFDSAGTFSLPIYDAAEQECLRLYLLDSGGNAPGGGYECPTKERLRWLQKSANQHPVPSILFQHIPLPEFKLCRGVTLYEPICSPRENAGEFAMIRDAGNIMAVFCGHDHKNQFVGSFEGIDLGYTPSGGFSSYGPGAGRGCRLITYHAQTPCTYHTQLLLYKDLVSAHTDNRLKEFFDCYLPTGWPPMRKPRHID